MKRRVLRPYVIPSIIVLFSILVALGSVLLTNSLKVASNLLEDEYIYVSSEVLSNNSVPVIQENEETKILKPFSDTDVKVLKSYYDYKAENDSQKNAIIYYQDTYIQNTGIDYGKEEQFPVLSILSGTVISVTEDDIVGKTVKVKHNNDMISIYQSLSTVDVKIDDEVLQGQKLGTSGTNAINSDMGNHLHFELYYKSKLVNPDDYYDKKLGEI